MNNLSLRTVDGIFRLRHQAELDKFLIAFLNFCQQRAGRHGHDGVPRNAPAKLLGNFIRHALGAFSVIRPHVHVHKDAQPNLPAISAQAVDLVVMTLDTDDFRAVNKRVQDLALLQIRRNEHVGFQTGGRGLGGDEIARLPVEAHATVSKPSSFERLKATLTTRSLNDRVG